MTKRPAFYIAAFFCLGIVTSSLLGLPVIIPLLASAVILAISIISLKKRILSHIALYLAIFFAGIASYQNSFLASEENLPANHISKAVSEDRHKAFLRGIVNDDPVTGKTSYGTKKTSFVIDVSAYKDLDKWQDACGLVSVNVYSLRENKISYGDEVEFEGLLYKPRGLKNPGTFDYEQYLRSKGIRASASVRDGFFLERSGRNAGKTFIKIAYTVRHYINNTIDRYFIAPYSGFLKAILVGERAGLDRDITDDFIKTGTVHVIAISGLHVGLIAGMILSLLALLRVPRKTNLIITTAVLVLYSFVAGANPPIVRAVIMFAVFAAGYIMERDADALNSLGLAAFFILLINPAALLGPGFQLSFVSVASVIVLTPRVENFLRMNKKPPPGALAKTGFYLLTSVSVSIAAFLGTWPIVAAYFNIVPVISIIANLAAIPALFILTIETSVLIIAGTFIGYAAHAIAEMTLLTERALFFINHLLANIPFAYFRTSSPSAEFLLLYYALLSLIFVPPALRMGRLIVNKKHFAAMILVFLNLYVWAHVAAPDKKYIEISFIDVGQGDSALVEFPGGATMLIDAGPAGDDDEFDAGRAVIAPYLWNKGINRIDALVTTHPHADHIGGAAYILDNFRVRYLIDGGQSPDTTGVDKKYEAAIKRARLRHINVKEGDRISGFGGVDISVLNPPGQNYQPESTGDNVNDDSVVLRMVSGDFSAIFCGDITEKAMEGILDSGHILRARVMKVPHHGSGLGSEGKVKRFFENISPAISVISSRRGRGEKGSYVKILDILSSLGSKCYVTNEDGLVTIKFDNGKYFVKCYEDIFN